MSIPSKYDGAPLNAVESRIDRGIVFEISDTRDVANGGGTVEYFSYVGNKMLIIESRLIISNGDELTYQGFKNAVVSARGNKIPIVPRNGFQSEKPEMIMYHAPTVVSTGPSFPSVYLPGSSAPGIATAAQFSSDGFVRIIEPNTQYVLRITNNGTTNPATIQYYLMWSEIDVK